MVPCGVRALVPVVVPRLPCTVGRRTDRLPRALLPEHPAPRAAMNVQVVATFILAIVCAAGGYAARDVEAERDMAELQKSEAVARAEQGKRDYGKLVAALDRAAGLDVELDRARSESERLRSSFERRLRRAEALADVSDGAELARCTVLLRESVELLSEGRELALREAARADSLAELR